jgi:Nif-specific regulatory protein
MELMGAERGFLALKNRNGDLVYSSIIGFNLDQGRLRISSTMIHKVMREGHSILTANAIREDAYREADSVFSYGLKSVLCVPLRTENDIIGCIYLDNREKTGSFSSADLEFLTILAHQISIAIENARLHKRVLDEQAALKSRLRLSSNIIAKSHQMVELYKYVHKVAPTKVPVLILGETGTGKELVARAIHDLSGREGQFIAVNCAAIPDNLLESELFGYEKGAFTDARSSKPGLFELSSDGTIFLDEIGELVPSLQPKLLRVLQDKKVNRLGSIRSRTVNVRIISATNRNLKSMMKRELFRQDLYYRIAGVELKVPPMRERKEDIPPLANFFLLKFAEENDLKAARISHRTMKILMAYDWPGNANELKNVIGRAALFGNGRIVHPEDLPEEIQACDTDSIEHFPKLEDIERQHIKRAFQRSRGNKRKAARMLGIARDTLYKKIEKYSIDTVSF